MLDGYSLYRKWSNNTSTSLISPAITATTNEWDSFKTGGNYDFDNVYSSIKELNDFVACNDEEL